MSTVSLAAGSTGASRRLRVLSVSGFNKDFTSVPSLPSPDLSVSSPVALWPDIATDSSGFLNALYQQKITLLLFLTSYPKLILLLGVNITSYT